MKHLTNDMKKLVRNRRLLTCYVLIAMLQVGLGLGIIAINSAKKGEVVVHVPPSVHVVKDVSLVQEDLREVLVQFHAKM